MKQGVVVFQKPSCHKDREYKINPAFFLTLSIYAKMEICPINSPTEKNNYTPVEF